MKVHKTNDIASGSSISMKYVLNVMNAIVEKKATRLHRQLVSIFGAHGRKFPEPG